MFGDERGGKIVLVAHCVLNQNSRVLGLASFKGSIKPIVEILERHGVGMLQMPCPELLYAGLKRQGKTKEQYDTQLFRGYCRRIASELADQVEEYVRNGMKVLAIVGVEGSPTCATRETTTLKEESLESKRTTGKGILIEELESELKKRKIHVPFYGIENKRIEESAAELNSLLSRAAER